MLSFVLLGFSPSQPPSKSIEKELRQLWGEGLRSSALELPAHIDPARFRQGSFFEIDRFGGSPLGYLYQGRVNACRAGGCSAIPDTLSQPAFEYFEYFVLMDTAAVIRAIRIYNYQASYGQEVTARAWLKQFRGLGPDDEPVVGKNIDGIAGATISVHALAFDLAQRSSQVREFHRGREKPAAIRP